MSIERPPTFPEASWDNGFRTGRHATFVQCAEMAETEVARWRKELQDLQYGSQAHAFANGRCKEAEALAFSFRQMAEEGGT